jgi:Lrp/AsnC family transcriptional regulator for asnA, asnC and gidA
MIRAYRITNKDEDSSRIIEELKKIPEVTECYYIGSYTYI